MFSAPLGEIHAEPVLGKLMKHVSWDTIKGKKNEITEFELFIDIKYYKGLPSVCVCVGERNYVLL